MERGLIFSDESVRGILAKLKTQSRRVVVNQGYWANVHTSKAWGPVKLRKLEGRYLIEAANGTVVGQAKMPFNPGDKIWVRERWLELYNEPVRDIHKAQVYYKADYCGELFGQKWQPARFMPKWRSRLLLPVISVRMEWLPEISEEDARAEGYEDVRDFRVAWEVLNGARGFGWETRPWVWRIEWER